MARLHNHLSETEAVQHIYGRKMGFTKTTSTKPYNIYHCKKRLVVICRVVTLVTWFTLVLEANCITPTVFLLFPPLFLILE